MRLIRTEDAAGHVLCRDMTQIIPGVTKDARFRKGHVVTEEDIPVLLSIGKEHLYVWEKTDGMLHEDEGAERLRKIAQNENMHPSEVKEGKIELIADIDGLFQVDVGRLYDVNSVDEIMIATRHTNMAERKGDKLAAKRVITLLIDEKNEEEAETAAGCHQRQPSGAGGYRRPERKDPHLQLPAGPRDRPPNRLDSAQFTGYTGRQP